MKDYGHLFRDDPEWSERAAAFSAKVRDVHELLAEHEPQAAAPPGRPRRRLPRRLPPGPRPGRPRPAARAAGDDPGPRRPRARRVGAVLRLGRRLEPAQPRACGRARPAQGPQPARHRARRPSPPPIPAARCRSASTPGCPSITRWSCSPPRSTEGSHDRRRPRPCPRRRRPHRRRPGLPRRAARALRAAPARAPRRPRAAAGADRRGRDARLPARDARRSARATGRSPLRPPALQDRRVEITGPVDRKMVINALNSGARGFMADFEDSLSPTWANVVQGQVNLTDAIEGTIEFTGEDGREYKLDDEVATLLVRPRGWHLVEKHVRVDGEPVAGAFVDAGLYLMRNAQAPAREGLGPVLLPAQDGVAPRGAAVGRGLRLHRGRAGARPRHGQDDRAHRDAARRLRDGGDPLRAARRTPAR